jgi:hypothetical protein
MNPVYAIASNTEISYGETFGFLRYKIYILENNSCSKIYQVEKQVFFAVEIMSCWNIGYYISNRYQRVIIRNCLPEQGNLKGGVPQWSVLGPLLFLLYINDITDNTQSLSRLFADDTSLLYSSNNVNEIEVIVNSDLSKIYNWSKEWLIDFNPKKTECIIFSTNQAANKPCIVAASC